MAAQEKEALARAQDLRFCPGPLPSPGWRRLRRPDRPAPDRCGRPLLRSQHDPHRGGRSGHPRWAPPSGSGPRIMAGIVISAPPFYGERDLRAVLSAVMIPTLHVTATRTSSSCRPHLPVADRLAVYEAIATSRKALAVFQGGSHSIFTDRPMTGGLSLNPQVKEATAAGALAFLDLAFGGDPEPLRAWSAAWKPILAVAPEGFAIASRAQPSASPERRTGARAACVGPFKDYERYNAHTTRRPTFIWSKAAFLLLRASREGDDRRVPRADRKGSSALLAIAGNHEAPAKCASRRFSVAAIAPLH